MDISAFPWRLVQNRVKRKYSGGRELDRFRGIEPAVDDDTPEAWVGSDTGVRNPLKPYEGHARCILPDGREMYVCEAVSIDPENILGKEHVARYGSRLGILVKILDAKVQLSLQAHPTRDFAKQVYNSDFGKEESWYIISLRDDTKEPPYVYMGFKEGITPDIFKKYYDAGDVAGMEKCVHKLPVKVGDMYFIRAGLPHAIGAGCLLIEVQEPSDLIATVSRLQEGTDEEKAAYDKRQLGTYIYKGSSYEENFNKCVIQPKVFRKGYWGKESLLLGKPSAQYFSVTRIDAEGTADIRGTGYVQVAVVLKGGGKLVWDGGTMDVKKSDELLLPANIKNMKIIPGSSGFSAVLSHPAGVEFDMA